jgi:hypothetical protein
VRYEPKKPFFFRVFFFRCPADVFFCFFRRSRGGRTSASRGEFLLSGAEIWHVFIRFISSTWACRIFSDPTGFCRIFDNDFSKNTKKIAPIRRYFSPFFLLLFGAKKNVVKRESPGPDHDAAGPNPRYIDQLFLDYPPMPKYLRTYDFWPRFGHFCAFLFLENLKIIFLLRRIFIFQVLRSKNGEFGQK